MPADCYQRVVVITALSVFDLPGGILAGVTNSVVLVVRDPPGAILVLTAAVLLEPVHLGALVELAFVGLRLGDLVETVVNIVGPGDDLGVGISSLPVFLHDQNDPVARPGVDVSGLPGVQDGAVSICELECIPGIRVGDDHAFVGAARLRVRAPGLRDGDSHGSRVGQVTVGHDDDARASGVGVGVERSRYLGGGGVDVYPDIREIGALPGGHDDQRFAQVNERADDGAP